MAFIDPLAFVEVMLFLTAVVGTWVSLESLGAVRRDRPDELRAILQGAAVPFLTLGAVAFLLSFWGETTWPLPGSYNILFWDVFFLFGIVLLSFGFAFYRGIRIQYSGLMALAAGIIVIFYGVTGYQQGLTKDPLETLLLYLGFGAVAILSLPASLVADWFLAPVRPTQFPWSRAPEVKEPTGGAVTEVAAPHELSATFRRVVSLAKVVAYLFPVFFGLAAIAALLYIASTVPAHLMSPP